MFNVFQLMKSSLTDKLSNDSFCSPIFEKFSVALTVCACVEWLTKKMFFLLPLCKVVEARTFLSFQTRRNEKVVKEWIDIQLWLICHRYSLRSALINRIRSIRTRHFHWYRSRTYLVMSVARANENRRTDHVLRWTRLKVNRYEMFSPSPVVFGSGQSFPLSLHCTSPFPSVFLFVCLFVFVAHVCVR